MTERRRVTGANEFDAGEEVEDGDDWEVEVGADVIDHRRCGGARCVLRESLGGGQQGAVGPRHSARPNLPTMLQGAPCREDAGGPGNIHEDGHGDDPGKCAGSVDVSPPLVCGYHPKVLG